MQRLGLKEYMLKVCNKPCLRLLTGLSLLDLLTVCEHGGVQQKHKKLEFNCFNLGPGSRKKEGYTEKKVEYVFLSEWNTNEGFLWNYCEKVGMLIEWKSKQELLWISTTLLSHWRFSDRDNWHVISISMCVCVSAGQGEFVPLTSVIPKEPQTLMRSSLLLAFRQVVLSISFFLSFKWHRKLWLMASTMYISDKYDCNI